MIQLYKLSTNPNIMVAAKKVMDERKAAGVDINSEVTRPNYMLNSVYSGFFS